MLYLLLALAASFEGGPRPVQTSQHLVTRAPEPLSIIRPQPHRKLPYGKLRCTDDDRRTIHIIISRVGQESKLWLLANKFYFDNLGSKIERVHPLKFLEVIFRDSTLAFCMRAIFEDFWKRINFMPEMRARLQARYDTKELLLHVDDFCKELDLPTGEVRRLLENKKWDAFLYYLINEKNRVNDPQMSVE